MTESKGYPNPSEAIDLFRDYLVAEEWQQEEDSRAVGNYVYPIHLGHVRTGSWR